MDRRVLEPRSVRFLKEADQNLYLETDAGRKGPVKVRWAFPLTKPDGYVIVADDDNEFVGLLKEYKKLDAQSLEVVEEELEENYFLPRITKIDDIDDRFNMMVWNVQTDKGPRNFEVKSRRRDIRWMSDSHVVISDVDGNRYEILDLQQLDAESRDLLEMEV